MPLGFESLPLVLRLDRRVEAKEPIGRRGRNPKRGAAGQELAPGQGATTSLWWRGYRNAADQRTPQRLILRFGSGDWREIPLDAGAGPAPFDVIAGAEIEIGSWLPAAVGAAAETTAGGAV